MSAQLTHHTYRTNGIQMHTVEQGNGPAVILCHGFPELWYTWRHQIPKLAEAGYRVIVPDLRGFGDTTVTNDIDDYSPQNQCADLLGLMDALELSSATIIGHDWGSVLAWHMALHYPERVNAAAGLNPSGFSVPKSQENMLELLKEAPGIWDYHFYFQALGVAEAEFERDVERFMTLIRRSSASEDNFDILYDFHNVRERGGLLVGYPEDAKRSVMLTEEDMNYYVEKFEKTGFRGPLNYYRVYSQMAEWAKTIKSEKVRVPIFVLTAGKDPVMTPDLTNGMEEETLNFTRHHIENCSHWSTEEHPNEVSQALIDWLGSLSLQSAI